MNINFNLVKAVLFDFDGTLADSMWMWDDIDIEYLGSRGIALPDTLQKEIEGMSFSETAIFFKETFHLDDSLEEIKADWNRMAMDKYIHEVPLKTGVLEFLQLLKSDGIRMGIATSNSRELVDAALESLAIQDFFQTVTIGCEVAAGKPSPDIYLKVAERLQVCPEECLVFEDVPAGILAGKRAGMPVIAVQDNFSDSMTEEKKELADMYINDYNEMIRLWKGGRTRRKQ